MGRWNIIDKIKEKIDEDKKDKETIEEYIKVFCESEKSEELFKEDENFKELKEFIKNKYH